MLFSSMEKVYNRLRLSHYRRLFKNIREHAGSLSATEAFSADVIHLMGKPSIKQFAEFLGISQPNATYKVNALIEKGYLVRETSAEDRREAHISVGEKFEKYYGRSGEFIREAAECLEKCYSRAELELFGRMLDTLADSIT